MGKSEIYSIPIQHHQSENNLLCVRSSGVKKMFNVIGDYVNDVLEDNNENIAQKNDDPNKIEVLYNQAGGHTFDGKNVGELFI